MGIDAFMFDAVSKECVYFDRVRNLRSVLDDPDAFECLRVHLRGEEPRAKSADVVRLAEACAASRLEDEVGEESWRQANRAHWANKVRDFALARPDGRFFVHTDHDALTSHELIREQGYRQVMND